MKLRIRPSLRPRKRYLVFRVVSEGPVDYTNMRNMIWSTLSEWMGEDDMARANIRLIKNLWNPKQKKGFLQCGHKYVDKVKVGLALIHQIGDQRVIFQTLRVSGTIKSGKEKTLWHATRARGMPSKGHESGNA